MSAGAPWLNMHPVSARVKSSSTTSSTNTSSSAGCEAVVQSNKRSFEDNYYTTGSTCNEDLTSRRHGMIVQDDAILATLGKLGISCCLTDVTAPLKSNPETAGFCTYVRPTETTQLVHVTRGRK